MSLSDVNMGHCWHPANVMEKMAQSWQARLWSSSKPGLGAHNPSYFSPSHPEASYPIKRFNTRRAHGFIDAACMRVRVLRWLAARARMGSKSRNPRIRLQGLKIES
jgi:hypothetical protein